MFYYKVRHDFLENPNAPINMRPIDLEGYTIVARTTSTPHLITLTPASEEDNRKVWEFRCDTVTEFERWMTIISAAFRYVNKTDNFVSVNPGMTNEREGRSVGYQPTEGTFPLHSNLQHPIHYSRTIEGEGQR